MHRTLKALLPMLLAVAGGWAAADRAPTTAQNRLNAAPIPSAINPTDSGWSVRFDVGKPYFTGGDTLRGLFELANASGSDAYGFIPVAGGNGCTYRIKVLDAAGNLVWQPGSIINGQFSGPGCLFGSTNIALNAGGSQHSAQFSLPLIYQNDGGFGTLGAPLDPGYYIVRAEIFYGGPNPTNVLFPGLSYAAEVPIQLMP